MAARVVRCAARRPGEGPQPCRGGGPGSRGCPGAQPRHHRRLAAGMPLPASSPAPHAPCLIGRHCSQLSRTSKIGANEANRTTPAFSLLETMKLHSQRSDWVLNGNCFHLRLFTCREQKPVGRWRHCCRWVRLTGIPSAMARIAQSFKKNKKNGVVAANVSFRFLSVGVVPDTAAAAAAGLAASPQPTQDAVGISD